MEPRGFIIACIAVWMIMTEINGQFPRQNNQRNAQHYRRYLSSSSRYRFRPNAKIRPNPNRPSARYSNLRYASPQAGVRGTLRPNGFGGINRHFGSRQALGYGSYLRKLSQGYYPQAYARQQNSVNSYSPYKTGFPLRAPSPGGYSPNYAPLPLSAPSLYGYGGYQADRWGHWSKWSQCSRSCDGGVQERTRTCMSARLSMTLSLYKGQGHNQGNCPGFGKEFQPCNTKPCVSVKSFQDQKYDARKHQCSRFDDKEYLGQKYTWMPYIRDGLNECRLYCMAKGFRMFVELSNKVDEGSPCGKNGNEACFGGICSREPPKKEPKRPNSLDAGANPARGAEKQQVPAKMKSPLGYRPPSRQNPNNRFRPLQSQNSLLASQNRIHQERNKFTQNRGRLPQNRGALPKNRRPQGLGRFPPNQGRLSSSRPGQFPRKQGRFSQNRLPLPQRQRPGLPNNGRIPNQGSNSGFQVSNFRALHSGSSTRPNGYLRGGKSSDQILRELNEKIKSGGHFNPAANVKVDKKVSGEFNKREGLKLGYNPIFKIPKGASNIRVEEARPSQNYLAVKVGDDYLVNGRWSIALKKDIKAAGTLIKYRLGKGPGSTEVITAAGPTTKEIQIVLLFQQGPPEVHYNYTLKVLGSRKDRVFKAAAVSARKNTGPGRNLKSRPTLHWSVDGWKKCTRPCGGGEQQLNIRCVAIYPNKRTKVVKSSYCHALKKPTQRKRMCNMHTCKPRWVLLPWKPCSKTCGQGAFQTRDVRCVKIIPTERGKVEVNSPFYECGPRPAIQKPCAYVPCYTWKTDNWSSCSKTCDKGVQTRKAFCTSGNRLHNDEQCDIKTKPEVAQVCNLRPCRTSWFIGKWSKCSKFCGEGVERRPVFCAGKDGSALSESLCKDQPKPSSLRACINRKCEGIWVTSNWTQCSAQCGLGHISRMVICLSMKDGLMNQVSEDNCDLTTKPESQKECKRKPCDPEWFTSEWSHCSRTCGRGIRIRQINCMLKNGQLGRGCQAETRPNAAMICQIRACENEIDEGVAKATFSGKATESSQEASEKGLNDGEEGAKAEEGVKQGSAGVVPASEPGRSTSTVQRTTQSQPIDRPEAPTEFSRVQVTVTDNSRSSVPTKRISSKSGSPVETRDSKAKKDGYAAAETVVAIPVTRFFKREERKTERQRELTTTETLTTREMTTTRAPTPKPTAKPTKAPRRQEVNVCRDSFKSNYCRVILRIGFCKFSTYRKRCCGSCEKSSVSIR